MISRAQGPAIETERQTAAMLPEQNPHVLLTTTSEGLGQYKHGSQSLAEGGLSGCMLTVDAVADEQIWRFGLLVYEIESGGGDGGGGLCCVQL